MAASFKPLFLAAALAVSAAAVAGPFDKMFGGDGGSEIDLGSLLKSAKDAFGEVQPEQERTIGREAAAVLLGAVPLVKDEALQRYVNRVGRWVALQTERPDIDWRFGLLDSMDVNAFAAPGGYVFVTKGLLLRMGSEAELAGVLAHELTHVLQRHSMRKLVRQAGMGVLIGIVFGDVSALSQLIELSSQLDSLSFDRSQERSADDGAIEIMAAAGMSPQNLAAFFEKIQKADAITGNIPELFQTHPLTDERIKRVTAAAEPVQPFQFDMDWEALKQRVKHSEAIRSPANSGPATPTAEL